MKKLLILIAIIAFACNCYSQAINGYYPLRIKKSVTFQDSTMGSCYVTIKKVEISNMCDRSAMYWLSVYKKKANAANHPEWVLAVDEIPPLVSVPVDSIWTGGNKLLKISQALRARLIELNPSWVVTDITIDN